jgi:membrane protein YdbS with pleckstrin-like domain
MTDMNTNRPSSDSRDALAAAATSGPDEPERIYYEGSPMVRGALSKIFLYGAIGIVLMAIPFLIAYFRRDTTTQEWRWPAWWLTLALIAAGLLLWVIPILLAKSLRYRISSYRIDFERGIFGKRIDTMELWHVDDINFQQTFLDRILGVGTIHVLSDDQTTPDLNMYGLPNPRPLFEALKQRVVNIKRSRGVIKVDSGH